MLIKFKDPDPRAGTVARMDSSRGQQLVDAGAADRVSESAAGDEVPPQPAHQVPDAKGGAVPEAAPSSGATGGRRRGGASVAAAAAE